MPRQMRNMPTARARRPLISPTRIVSGAVALAGAVAIAGAAGWLHRATNDPASTPQAASTPAATPTATQTPMQTPSAAAPAQAAATQTPATPTGTPAAANATPQADAGSIPAGGAAQQAFIDPKTGKLRPAEHDDAATLGAGGTTVARKTARTAAAAAEPQEFEGPGGAVGVAVPDELQTYTVATKTPDGRIAIDHATGPTQAKAIVRNASKKGAATKSGSVPEKEERNDR